MKKLITILTITFLCSFQNKWADASKATRGNNFTITPNETWALAGTINDFTKLKSALMKDTTNNKELIKWIDEKLFKVNLKR